MPGIMVEQQARKRKRAEDPSTTANGNKPRKAPKSAGGGDTQTQILLLEEQILDSSEHYGNITQLQTLLNGHGKKPKTATLAAVALCRVFCRLIAGERLVKNRSASDAESEHVQFLKQQLRTYVRALCTWIGSPDAATENTALTLLMRVIKEEVLQEPKRAEQAWRTPSSTFLSLVNRLLDSTDAEGARHAFVQKYVEEHDDVRFHTFLAMKLVSAEGGFTEDQSGNAIDLLAQIEGIPKSEEELKDWYGQHPSSKKHPLLSLSAHRKAAQDAWLAIFRSPLTYTHRKKILDIMNDQILPWFTTKMEILTDFLTDSFNAGGSTSLLALSGLFHLMTHKNIDYPDFYTKLYSLLDENILHSKHRSRFFRLLDTFMASSHLPAALVASFVKRLSRLALQAPPGATVWIVPWTYNLLRQHPSCTFMLHRPINSMHTVYALNPDHANTGVKDPFDMTEPNPMHTRAIDSSLWELETLQSHYHPNVATLTRILGEQFTKREYQLEDFSDHSYASLIEAELGKDIKKAPVVEWEIPKRIVTEEGDDRLNPLGQLLDTAIKSM